MRRRGSVLLYVVWVMLLLSLFASSVGSRSLFALDTAQRLTEQLRAAYVARAGARLAAAALAEDQTATVDGLGEPWAHNPGRFKDHPFGGGTFRIVGDVAPSGAVQYGLTDEERRLNVNTASAEALQRLLEVAGGLRDNEAQALAEAILDWRDPDDDQRPSGAEGFYYRSLAHGYDCKDGPFEHVEELRLLRGMTPQLYERLAPHVTVFGAGPVNVNTAGRTV
ncbi:MAG: general secretion pathway protein GspK, partial [Candidatus Omnitrophica bacterium]|nr:general secretion pathway protein GspK [Candidatus Omnitrophota bacterium]